MALPMLLLTGTLEASAVPSPPSLSGYTCFSMADIAGTSCDIRGVHAHGTTLPALATVCNSTPGCRGFNNNGHFKRCVRTSCGAQIRQLPHHESLISCYLTNTPINQPTPPGCEHPAPTPPGPPGPGPPRPSKPVPPYNCSVTAARPDCNCSGVHPPFEVSGVGIQPQLDYHFPEEEDSEARTLVTPRVVSISGRTSATLADPTTKETRTLTIGDVAWGWELSQIITVDVNKETVVLEHDFDLWAQIVFVSKTAGTLYSIRKPVGIVAKIRQPHYAFSADFNCRQDIDPTDWLGRLAANASEGQPTIRSAIELMAPNPDSGLFGNPEEDNKFILTGSATLLSTPFVAKKHAPNQTSVRAQLWSLLDQLPMGCFTSAENYRGGAKGFENVLTGMMGGQIPMRAVSQGMWTGSDTDGCGAEIMAVAKPWVSGTNVSTALLKVVVIQHGVANVSYVKATVNVNTSAQVSVVEVADQGGQDFYAALFHNVERWADFEEKGARIRLPSPDTRYRDTANSLLSMYLNTDRGLLPEYGGGKFWNTYNEFLPLDTLALCGALLEWGHTEEALSHLGFVLDTRVCSDDICETVSGKAGTSMKNVSKGEIIYSVFGCDSDADYGRLISLFVQAVRYSDNVAWAMQHLYTIQAMASLVIAKRAQAVAAFPPSSPLHGIVPGSPEHDICGGPGYFFSVNVWYVRGLLDLHRMHQEFKQISANRTLESLLLETAESWREDIRHAADFTAVHRTDGRGLFFLHPVVGSVYGERNDPERDEPLKEGGDEATCVDRKTCFASMTASLPNGGSLQTTNYANFRIFSETLLAGVLEERHELAIMNFRESHRGTLLGMTRFRDGLDDMPILGYNRGSLDHDRIGSFHRTLSGHTLNYLSRGTFWGTEQRQQSQSAAMIVDGKYRNNCGVGGEDCSLCMVSSVASAYWIRWMMASDNYDESILYLARMAPTRYYTSSEHWGISNAPTRFGRVSFTAWKALSNDTNSRGHSLVANVSLQLRASVPIPTVAMRLSSGLSYQPFQCVRIEGDGRLAAWHEQNETAWVTLNGSDLFELQLVAQLDPCGHTMIR